MAEFILDIAKAMHGFQERNNIKAQCVTNTQYLLDCIKNNFPYIKAKAKAVFVINKDIDTKTLGIITHVVVDIGDNRVLDPSYETASMKNTTVYTNFKHFKNALENINLDNLDVAVDYKLHLEQYMALSKTVDDMNNGKLTVCDKDFYNKQADYVESRIK